MAKHQRQGREWDSRPGSRALGQKATVHDIITERIMKELESGTIPWQRPWNAPEWAPRNMVSGKAYRGINRLLLGSLPGGCPWWLTYRQAEEMGGHVRKGEHGTPVVFWKVTDKTGITEETQEGETTEDSGKRIDKGRRWICRYYTVFNATQCEGLPEIPEIEIPPDRDPIAAADAAVARYLGDKGPRLSHQGNRAYYRPADDSVTLPERGYFESSELYYSVLFHELGHSTGHATRLNRLTPDKVLAPFGSEDYSKEELVAEMTAAFLCAETGIEQETIKRSASYIAGWLKTLDGDRRLVVFAASQAQKAADFISGN